MQLVSQEHSFESVNAKERNLTFVILSLSPWELWVITHQYESLRILLLEEISNIISSIAV
ncbi:hypothetical protein Cni_G10099 [Canna indica]|uniref:Uncharacterized protein n=1 Tax=Canna indica TaxID=4628 RepID=A0AAQ3K3N7_9LILI|nr:hypothetical protein Cni_G10099 [Canna indica]